MEDRLNMNNQNKKKWIIGITAILVIMMILGTVILFFYRNTDKNQSNSKELLAESWGPQDRETFIWNNPASYVTFNSITPHWEMRGILCV